MSSRRAKDVLAEMKAKDAKVRNRRSRAKAGAVVLSHLNRPVLSKKSKARRRSANRPAASTKRVVVPSFLREATGRKFVGGRVNDASRAAEKKPMGSSQGKREETASDPSGTTPAIELGAITTKDFMARVARDVNCVSDESPTVRIGALRRLQACLFGKARCLTDEQLQDVFPEFTKPLLKRFSDSAEKCRELSIQMVTSFMKVVLDLGPSLPYVMPAIEERLGRQYQYDLEMKVFVRDLEAHNALRRGRVTDRTDVHTVKVVEPSEEVRFLLAGLLSQVFDTAASVGVLEMVKPYLHNMVVCAHACTMDPFPDLRIKGYELVGQLCSTLPKILKYYAPGLVKSCMLGLDHRHSKVRLACLNAVNASVTCEDKAKCRGAGTEAIVDLIGHRDENVVPVSSFYRPDAVVNYFAKLGIDRSPVVRKRFVEVIGGWMLNLPDRVDHESRLLPYLVTAVGDMVPAVHTAALQIVEALGIQYEKEHHDEVIERKQYGVDGDRRVDRQRVYPAPFKGRPRLGSRLYVRTSAPRFVKVVLRELSAWTASTKIHAARLIVVLMVYLEEHITHDVHLLLRCLYNSISDDEIGEQMEICCKLAGWFADPDAYVPLVLPYLNGDAAVPASANIESVLRVLALILREVRPSRILSHLRPLVRALDSSEYTNTRSPAVAEAYVMCLSAIASLLNGRIGAAVGASFDATGRLHDVTNDVTRLMRLLLSVYHGQTHVQVALNDLAQGVGAPSVTAAVSERVVQLLQPVLTSYPDRLWAPTCSRQALLEHTLALVDAGTLAGACPLLLPVFQRFLDADLGPRKALGVASLSKILLDAWGRCDTPRAFSQWQKESGRVETMLLHTAWGVSGAASAEEGPEVPASTKLQWLELLRAAISVNPRVQSTAEEEPRAEMAEGAGAGAGAGAEAGTGTGTAEVDEGAGAGALETVQRVELAIMSDERVASWAASLLPVLESLLRATSAAVRQATVSTLALLLERIGAHACATVPTIFELLVRQLDDSNDGVRITAANSMSLVVPAAQAVTSSCLSEGVDDRLHISNLLKQGLRFYRGGEASQSFLDSVMGYLHVVTAMDPAATVAILDNDEWRSDACMADVSGTAVADVRSHAELLLMFAQRSG